MNAPTRFSARRTLAGLTVLGLVTLAVGLPKGRTDERNTRPADRNHLQPKTQAEATVPHTSTPTTKPGAKLQSPTGIGLSNWSNLTRANALTPVRPIRRAEARAAADIGDPCTCDLDCAGLDRESGCILGQCVEGECEERDAPTQTICENGDNYCTIGRCDAGTATIHGDAICNDSATVDPAAGELSRCAKECDGGANDGHNCYIAGDCGGGNGCTLKTHRAPTEPGWNVTCAEVGGSYDCSLTHDAADVVRCCETTDPGDVGYKSSAACTTDGGIGMEITDPDDTLHLTGSNPRCPQYSSGIAPTDAGAFDSLVIGPVTPPAMMCNNVGFLGFGEHGAPCEIAADCHTRCASGDNQGEICQPANEAIDCLGSTCVADTCVANADDCDGIVSLGDDYDFGTANWIRLQEIRFRGGVGRANEVITFDIYDDSTPPVRVTSVMQRFDEAGIATYALGLDCDEGCDTRKSLCDAEDTRCETPADPPRVIPPRGWLVMRAARHVSTESFPVDLNGYWVPTDTVDVGSNDANKIWVDGGIISGTETDPLPQGQRVLAFELVGEELAEAPMGGCCEPGGGCVDTFQHLCRFCLGSAGTHLGDVCDRSASWGEGTWSAIDRNCPGTYEGCSTNLWHGNRNREDYLADNAEDCPEACSRGSCCDPDGSCSVVPDAGACSGTFLGLGTSCSDDTAGPPPGPWEPNCCEQPAIPRDPGGGCCADLYQCQSGEWCNPLDSHSCDAPRTGPCELVCLGAEVLELRVPALLPPGQRTVLDITTDSTGTEPEGGLDDCRHGSDPGWFVSWHLTECAHVTLNLCCNEPVFVPAGSVVPNDVCPCDQPGSQLSPNPNRYGYGAAARNNFWCEDGNLSIEWTLGPGTYHWEPNTGKDCEGTGDDCETEAQCAPGVACLDHRQKLQIHIIAEPCIPAACCLIDEDPANPEATCDSSHCEYLNIWECTVAGGDFLGNLEQPVPDCPVTPPPCERGSCCIVGGECDDGIPPGTKVTCPDCKTQDAAYPYHGGLTCEEAPCNVCPFEDAAHGQGASGEYIFVADRNFGMLVADDFTPAESGVIERVCYNHAYIPPDGGECADNPSDDDLEIRFYVDNFGLPGTEIWGPELGDEAQWDSHSAQPGSRTWRYSAPIIPGVMVDVDECYWISIMGHGRPDCTVHWVESRDGNNYRVRDDDGTWGPEDLRSSDYSWWIDVGIVPAITPWVDGGCGDIPVACCRRDGSCNEENLSTCLADNGVYFPIHPDPNAPLHSCDDEGFECPVPAGDDCEDAVPICQNVCTNPANSLLSSRWSCRTTADCPEPDTCEPWAPDPDNGYCTNADLLDDGPVCSLSARDCYDASPCRPYPDAEIYRCYANKDNRLATTDGPSAGGDCAASGESSFQADIWHKINAPCTGILVIDECRSQFTYDGMLAVFGDHTSDFDTRCPISDNDDLIMCNDDFCPGIATVSGVQTDTVYGGVYLLRTGGWAADGREATAAQGTSTMNIGMICPSMVPPVNPPGLPDDPTHQAPKNRYVSIDTTTNEATEVAWHIEAPSIMGWIGSPFFAANGDLIARVVDTPVYRVWTEETLHVGDCEIAPATDYEIRGCLPPHGQICSIPLTIGTVPEPSYGSTWADVVGSDTLSPPQGIVNVVDLMAIKAFMREWSFAPPMTWVDLAREVPSGTIDGRDVAAFFEALVGEPYPGDPSACEVGALNARSAGTTVDAGPQEDPPALSCKLFDITTREPLPVTSQGLYRVIPDQRVLMELYLEDTMENLESYQTKLAITRTSGDSGSVSVVCNEAVDMCTQTTEESGVEICAFHENAAEVPDFVFAANVLDVDGGTSCPPRLATATLYGGSSVPPEPPGVPGYLASYALDISSDAGNGVFRIAFEREEQAYDSASYLLRGVDNAFSNSIQFRPDPGVPCAELNIIGDCNSNSIPDDCEVDSRLTGSLCDQGFCAPGQCGTAENCDWQQNNLEPDECQPNTDVDPTIDACDLCQGFHDEVDVDGDTVPDGCDQCPGFDDLNDGDGDTVPDDCDNCPVDANAKVESDGTPALCAPPAGQFWQLDSDCDDVGDECDKCPGFDDNVDSDGDGVPDGCDLCPGLNDTYDCNDNLRPDCLDIDQAYGGPCNTGDCSPDCNGNDIPDECDIQGSPDGPTYCTDSCVGCPPSALNERCETDCNEDGVPDSCHYGELEPRPMAGNSIKACCTTNEDCLIAVCGPKKCQGGPHANEECTDDNQCTDSVCAYCSTTVSCRDGVCYARKNRYISFVPHTGGESIAIQIRLVSMKRCRTDFDLTDETCVTDGDCRAEYRCEEAPVVDTAATSWWVGQPVSLLYEESCSPAPCRREDYIARVVGDNTWDAGHKRVWPAGLIHVGDCEIAPVATYEVRTATDEGVFGPPLVLGTIVKPNAWDYGDVVGVVSGGAFTPSQGVVNVTDIQAQQITFQGGFAETAPAHTMWIDLHGQDDGLAPNHLVNVGDLQVIKFGFVGDKTHTQGEGKNPADCP